MVLEVAGLCFLLRKWREYTKCVKEGPTENATTRGNNAIQCNAGRKARQGEKTRTVTRVGFCAPTGHITWAAENQKRNRDTIRQEDPAKEKGVCIGMCMSQQ
jgi:hypothetical protein